MPPFPHRPTSIRRPQTLFIYSSFTLNKSIKNYPKHFKCLKIETKVPKYGDPQILSKSHLKTLQRRAKSLKVLNLEKHEQFFKLKVHQVLTLIKSFNHISSLSLFGNFCAYFSNKSYPKWLTHSKKLIQVIFGPTSASSFHPLPSLSLFNTIHAIYQKTIKYSKLLSLDRQSREALLPPKSYPSTLNKLSLNPDAKITRAWPPNLFYFFHLHHLSILHLKTPLLFKHLLEILNCLPNPHRVTHLTAFISGGFESDESSAEKLAKACTNLQSLFSLSLKINSFFCVSTLSKFFKNSSNLHEINLSLPIQKQKELIELALFIGNLKNLSILAIKNSAFIQGDAGEGHHIFFSQISRLDKLRSLEISLCGDHSSLLRSEFFNGCLGEFAGCLERLQELREIKFTQSEVAISSEFDSLADALKEIGSRLKKLNLTFWNGEKKIDHLKKLNKAFKMMENLEELFLKNFWAEKESLVQFGEVISELKWIRAVQLYGKNPCLEKVDLVKTIMKILTIYGLEELKWFGDGPIREWKENFSNVKNPVDIKGVISRNPRLYSVCLDYYGEQERGLDFKNVKSFLP